jgi:hypothetical protein
VIRDRRAGGISAKEGSKLAKTSGSTRGTKAFAKAISDSEIVHEVLAAVHQARIHVLDRGSNLPKRLLRAVGREVQYLLRLCHVRPFYLSIADGGRDPHLGISMC